uniref:PDZ domain-containing protein n=1 Tax=Branchiostoma floridae TaxID=7739 RepID=C3YPD1_BRAFL|eukprot:XP_002601703.1 hypothetical protein BRAFLDRAFT_76078 [Branchiostoma floridae]
MPLSFAVFPRKRLSPIRFQLIGQRSAAEFSIRKPTQDFKAIPDDIKLRTARMFMLDGGGGRYWREQGATAVNSKENHILNGKLIDEGAPGEEQRLTVILERVEGMLGFNIMGGNVGDGISSEGIYVSRIVEKGPADEQGKLRIHDRIMQKIETKKLQDRDDPFEVLFLYDRFTASSSGPMSPVGHPCLYGRLLNRSCVKTEWQQDDLSIVPEFNIQL